MCGIAGLLALDTPELDAELIEPMTELVRHRGPDGRGTVVLGLGERGLVELPPGGRRPWRVALGHRRLSIIDLSEAGHQPMSRGPDLWITYNGEIYNYLELRAELASLGHVFRSTSDTEVILAAYEAWGTGCFARLRGMWGLLIVDGRRRVAIASRDRLGIKPLYLLRARGAVAICSEVKQLTALPFAELVPEREALLDYLATGYEDTGRTFFRGVESLPPGTWCELSLETLEVRGRVPYWHPEGIRAAIRDPDDAARAFAAVLRESVHLHLRSDVPVGCALSGGLDSSAIALLVHERAAGSGGPLHTFTATFPGDRIDERGFAEAAIDRLSATPHFITPTAEGLLEDLDRFVWIHDEPVGTVSQYAAWCIARTTREAGVPVTLNGQGGDEVLAAYWQSYFLHLTHLARDRRPLAVAEHFAGAVTAAGNPELALQVPVMLRRYLARSRASGSAQRRLRGLLGMSEAERRIYEIRELYLPRLLKWDDRNFMAFSVEGRYPFLDHVVIETALTFAPEALYARGWTKEPLRRGLADLLPPEIARRRSKLGFEAPQDAWLRGPLAATVDAWLAGDSPLWGFVDRARLRKLGAEVRGAAQRREEPHQELFRHFMADRWLRAFAPGVRR